MCFLVAEKKSKPTRRAASKPALTTRPPAPALASKSVGGSPLRDHQLSAKDRAIHYFQNRLSEQAKLIDQLGKENRLLNRLQKKQEKEWSKIQQQEDELPHILQRHSEEVGMHATNKMRMHVVII